MTVYSYQLTSLKVMVHGANMSIINISLSSPSEDTNLCDLTGPCLVAHLIHHSSVMPTRVSGASSRSALSRCSDLVGGQAQ